MMRKSSTFLSWLALLPEGVSAAEDETDMRIAAQAILGHPDDIWKYLSLAARYGLTLPRAVHAWLHDKVSFTDEENKAKFSL